MTFVVGNGAGANGGLGSVFAAERQADGKILIGGFFDNYNGTIRQNVARLNTDGSLDNSFNPNTGGYGTEFFTIQSDGKIVVAGAFSASNLGAIRLNTDGTTDNMFFGGVVDDTGYVVTQQADGKILVGGFFRRANGAARRNLARFNLDGTLDNSFDPGNNFGGFNSPSVWSIGVQSDGKIMAGGFFSVFAGNARNYVARLNSNGTLDNSFTYSNATTIIRDIEIQPDGKIISAGFFSNPVEQLNSGIVRLLPNGSYAPTISDTFTGASGTVVEIELLPDGKALIMGAFTTYNGTARNRIARINPDASLDTTFNPGTGANSTVFDVALLSNGQMYVGGFFTTFNGAANTNDIVRLNANGSVDSSFNSGAAGFNGGINTLLLEPDGKILAGGNFLDYNGTSPNRLVLLNTNGTLDGTFTSPLDNTFTNFVYRLYRQADGKTLVGGGFTTPRNSFLRLSALAVSRRAPFDFDGDNRTDIAIFRPAPGQ